MARGFEEAYSKLRFLDDGNLDKDRIPTVEEKLQISYDIFKLSDVELASVLTMIEESCPYAISRKISNDEVLINFDALSPPCFHDVNSFILRCSSFAKAQKSKKRKSGDITVE